MNPTTYYRFDLPPGVLIDGRAFLADVETLRAMASDIQRATDPSLSAGDAMLERVAAHWNTNINEVRGRRRFQNLVYARWHFTKLAVQKLGWSQRDVDRYFGAGKGSASFGHRKINSLIEVDKEIREKVEGFKP